MHHERGNEFDAVTVKAVRALDNATVGHLPREIFRATIVDYMLQNSTNYFCLTYKLFLFNE